MVAEGVYDGFEPDRKVQYIIPGVGLAFFITSCAIVLTLFPTLFSTAEFAAAQEYSGLPPTQEQVKDLIGIALVHLIWALVPFLIAGFVFRKRRDALVYATALVLLSVWIFRVLPLSYAGNILLVGVWGIATVLLFIYRVELD